ncbi:MAG TPA: ABATE domain-containing protein [Actinoplanes sp.]|nr:ABATE domain-containing protein [Actinoplanes sp.]
MAGKGTRAPAAELAFRWRGGRPALDFTATVGERWRGRFERLREPADLARWFGEAGLTDAAVAVSPARLRQARQLREALYRLFTAVRTAAAPNPADVDLVHRWATRPAPGPGLMLLGDRLAPAPAPPDATALLTAVARDAADLVTGPLAARIRECDRPDCALLFVDESRAGARRWCSMDTCGARSKMSVYRSRHGR